MRFVAIICSLLALAACGGTGVGSGDSSLAGAVGLMTADWVVLDLSTGTATGQATIPDLATNTAYRTTLLAFRRIPAGTTVLGATTDDTWAQGGEAPTTVQVGEYWIAAFELTRAQWRLLANSEPWTTVTPSWLAGDPSDAAPACGLSLDLIRLALARHPHLGIPDDAQWERASRAAGARFPWGGASDGATVAAHAWLQQTTGPAVVGGRLPNALGLYDCAGNVWEWTDSGHLRGGSWRDGLPMARCANRLELDPETTHALAGVRLRWQP